MGENIERFFYDDIRDKKKTASGAFHKTGKGVKHRIGGVKFPSDFMTNKEKKLLNGEVKTYFMYENLITKAEFDQQDEQTQKAMLIAWRNQYTSKQIQQGLGCASQTFYNLVDKYDLPKGKRGGNMKAKSKKKNDELMPAVQRAVAEVVQAVPVQPVVNGLYFEYNGSYYGKDIGKILDKLELLLDDENTEYKISLSISELPKKKQKPAEQPITE